MMEKYKHVEVINWAADFLAVQSMTPPIHDPRAWGLQNALAPFSNLHVNSLSPAQLCGKPDSAWLMSKSPVLSRDGMIPLMSYFHECQPTQGLIRLLIAEEFLTFVPTIWQTSVKGY